MSAPPQPPADPPWPGYGLPTQSYTASPIRHISHRRMLVILSAALVVLAAVVSLVAWLLAPPPTRYKCPPDCGHPPSRPPQEPVSEPADGQHFPGQLSPPGAAPPGAGPPVSAYPRFSPADGAFSVQYPKSRTEGPLTVTDTLETNGVQIQFGDLDGHITLFGQPADNRTAHDIAVGLIRQSYPGAHFDYEITNAMVGYQPGYGEVDDYTPQSPTSSYTELRVVVLVAVKNDYALAATAAGPYREFTPDNSDHPSGTGLGLAPRMGQFINSFTWKGDPVR